MEHIIEKDIEKWPVKIPSFDLNGKVAIITGGTKGIGYGITMLLAYYGATVVVCSRNAKACENVASQVRALGGQSLGIAADVSCVEEIQILVDKVAKKYGHVDILINNAGIAVTEKILDTDIRTFDRVLDTNLKSVYFMSQAVADIMKTQKNGGKIIQMASIGGLKGSVALSCYGASKAAVINLTKTMALEWSRYNIQINAICPGYVMTEINEDAFADDKVREKALKGIPQRRFGTVDEVAALVLFLTSEASNMITGQAIVADMGATCG